MKPRTPSMVTAHQAGAPLEGAATAAVTTVLARLDGAERLCSSCERAAERAVSA